MRIYQDRQLVLSQHVDEAGGDNHSLRVDRAFGVRFIQVSDRSDASVTDADVSGIPRRAGAINNATIADDDVKIRGKSSLNEHE